MAINESGEMYLEAIFVLSKKINGVHAIDVGEYLGFSKPSVSRALSCTRRNGIFLCLIYFNSDLPALTP